MLRIGFISLGCPKNLVDSEKIMGLLLKEGYKIVHPEDADVVIINTCAFLVAILGSFFNASSLAFCGSTLPSEARGWIFELSIGYLRILGIRYLVSTLKGQRLPKNFCSLSADT